MRLARVGMNVDVATWLLKKIFMAKRLVKHTQWLIVLLPTQISYLSILVSFHNQVYLLSTYVARLAGRKSKRRGRTEFLGGPLTFQVLYFTITIWFWIQCVWNSALETVLGNWQRLFNSWLNKERVKEGKFYFPFSASCAEEFRRFHVNSRLCNY